MLRILGRATSTNVQKILWFCDEAGIAYEHDNDIGGAFGGNDTPEYLAMNPNGKVPTVVDDNFVMWESNSIIRYLARKHKSALYPSEFRARNVVERWMDWELSVVARQQGTVLVGLVRTKPEDRDNAKIAAAQRAWVRGMTILDGQLAQTGYVAGDDFTLADIPLGPIAHRFFSLDIERPDLANLRRWYDTLAGRPAFQEWCLIEMA
ncbi:MAG: glutathione S-transferase [Alphaproteobacteria bacterium]|nr:glutathione S-transferase [Alphaproteobacteria bacterium]HCP01653.1 glutathione S-transferase [Rhodospirillaceae bacterium]